MNYTYAGMGAGIVVAGIGLYFLLHTYGGLLPTTLPTLPIGNTGTVIAHGSDIPEGYKEYRNVPYRFKLYFPEDLSVKEYRERGNALTVTFRSPEQNKGFQVFAIPYSESQISETRFRMDEPSGIRLEETPILIDNQPATMFFSENGLMGKTREVWAIKNRFLYEVTTYKAQDAWLAGLMTYWKFF